MNTFLSSVISDLLGTVTNSGNSPAWARYKQELYANFQIAVSMLGWFCFAATE
jgi:arginine/ornithine N-succinyltransferase beta subunit